ncbi:uncharacterized protein BO96DRAFT_407559 [Aspergillus niger CBS 101883]|uniref:uncharacterized protein n=1 Tax=Aspergillus lacticoffeatus (strain CBS 101883) TaxID=1450533 RepID=UPI000D7EFAE0|nr:uncharacterized protein BO96DRAFT_407559 [Aspergillus niger CBS 101883]PYH62943.1 hypothetical protein BO96DRAFT_407559 [Aspergillus niger CBS 101883]
MSRSTDSGGATADAPSLPWRALSSTTIFGVAALCRSFLFLCSRPQANGLDQFLELLDSRSDPSQRTRGLLTVSNHTSVYVPTLRLESRGDPINSDVRER